MREDIELNNYNVQIHRTAHSSIIIATTTVSLAAIIGSYYGLSYLFIHFPWLTYVMLTVVVTIVIFVPLLLLLWLAKIVLKPVFRDIGSTGTSYVNVLGKIGILSPLSSSTVKVGNIKNKLGITSINIVLPTFIDCVKSGVIKADTEEYFIGFNVQSLNKKNEEHVYTSGRTSSIITGGKSGSGKTRFEATIVFQMIYKKKIVIVVDPHGNKPDGLYSLLKGLEDYIIFATSPNDIVDRVKYFKTEMENRKLLNPEIVNQLPDIVLVLEEMRAIYHSDKISQDDKEIILETIEKCDVEYRGFKGFCYVTSQSFKVQDVGSTNFRSQISSKLVLTMGLREANYITEDETIAKKIARLPKRHVLYVSDDIGYGEEIEAKIADVEDNIGKRLAAYLRIHNFTTVDKQLEKIQQLQNTYFLPETETLMSIEQGYNKKQLAPIYTPAHERVTSMNTHVKPCHDDELFINDVEDNETLINDYEQSNKYQKYIEEIYNDKSGKEICYKVIVAENGRNVQSEDRKFFVRNEDIQEVINAYANLKIQGVQISRRKIMEYLHTNDKDTWNNSKWHMFSYICYYKGI